MKSPRKKFDIRPLRSTYQITLNAIEFYSSLAFFICIQRQKSSNKIDRLCNLSLPPKSLTMHSRLIHSQNKFRMLKSFIKIGWRNLFRNKGYSAINIGGLAMGMAVAILIGLWISDELSFNKNHDNYKYIARVMQNTTHDGMTGTGMYMPVPLAAELTKSFENDFEHVVISSFPTGHTISFGNMHFTETGNYMHADAPRMFTLQMLLGTADGLKELNSFFLSESTAKRIFGDGDPINKLLTIDGKTEVKVTGVYKDMPRNSEFYNIDFIAPWEQFVASNDWVNRVKDTWDQSVVQVFVQLAPNSEADIVSQKIKTTIYDRESDQYKVFQRSLFLHPMSKWHLYEEFTNGVNTGGRIQFVWLFGIICIFILMLGCINFMNLSTARSESRAKEVGIRKAIGSIRRQLITQFFSESLLVAGLGFILSIGLVFLALPQFNRVADKQIDIPWESVYFWSSCIGFTLFTGGTCRKLSRVISVVLPASESSQGNFSCRSCSVSPTKSAGRSAIHCIYGAHHWNCYGLPSDSVYKKSSVGL